MSNVMSLKSFQNKVHRNGFDLSQKVAFTAKTGEILPVFFKEVLPGDHFDIKSEWFTRTMPLSSAAYVRMREYYDVYFVPYRLLWKYFDMYITQTNQNDYVASSPSGGVTPPTKMPYLKYGDLDFVYETLIDGELTNDIGISRAYTMQKLAECLSYGHTTKVDLNGDEDEDPDYHLSPWCYNYGNVVNVMPFLAYQKICQDYFRFDSWQDAEPWRCNADYCDSDTNCYLPNVNDLGEVYADVYSPFELNYCNFNKDLYMGLLPSPQFGDAQDIGTISVNADGEYSYTFDPATYDGATDGVLPLYLTSGGYLSMADDSLSAHRVNTITLTANNTTVTDLGITMSALRNLAAMQKWQEITQSGQYDFKSQVEKHWGVKAPDAYSSRCKYVGGWSTNLNINEVVNNNLASEDSEATIAGKGTSAGNGHITFDSKDYGLLMCVYHNMPLLDYQGSIIEKFNTKTDATDFAIPEFDSIGMDVVTRNDFILPPKYGAEGDNYLGYAPRYWEYKTSVDVVRGAFLESLSHWVAPISTDYINEYFNSTSNDGSTSLIDGSFFRVNPSILNPIFYTVADDTVDTDQFLCNSFFDIKAVRNLDYNGLPY